MASLNSSSCHVSSSSCSRHHVLDTDHWGLGVAYYDAEGGVDGGGGGDELLDAEVPRVGAAEECLGGGEEKAAVDQDVIAVRRPQIRLE